MVRTAVNWMLAAAAALAVLVATAGSSFSGGLAGAVNFFSVQIAMTCGAISLIRVVRHRGDPSIPSRKLEYILRAAGVCVSVVLASAILDLAWALGHSGSGPDMVPNLMFAIATTVGLIAAAGLVSIMRAWRQVRDLARLEGPGDVSAQSAIEDLMVVLKPLSLRMTDAFPRTKRWLEPSTPDSHPWPLAGGVALVAGIALAVSHLLAEGGNAIPVVLLVSAIFVSIEAAAVLVCFAALGRYLGLKRVPDARSGVVQAPQR